MKPDSFLHRFPSSDYVAAIISGGLLVLSFPKFDLSFLAWVALVPLLFVLTSEGQTLRKAFGLGWITGWVFFFFSCNWITHSMIQYGGMNVVLAYLCATLFTAITGFFPGLFALITTRLVKSLGITALGLAPFVWVATEWLRAITTGVTWNALGVSQVNYFVIAQLASSGGVASLSFIICAVSVVLILAREVKRPPVKWVVAAYLLPGLMAWLVMLSNDFKPGSTLNKLVSIAVVQPNLPVDILTHSDELTQRNESGLETNLKLTREAISQANKKADIIVWTESPMVLNYEQDETTRNKINAIIKETKAYLIFSAIGREGEKVYNSVQTVTPDGKVLKRYDKMRLVPFGEYVPFRSVLGHFVPAMIGDFNIGNTAVVNSLKLSTQLALIQNEQETNGEVALERTTTFVKPGTFICYEAAYPNIVRQFVNNGASLLINVSDDAWFGNSAGAQQHLHHARMRAIENDRDIVRVTNSGISALITAQGKVVESLPTFVPASKVWAAESRKGLTMYTKYGDWFAYLSAIITAIAILFSFVYYSRSQ